MQTLKLNCWAVAKQKNKTKPLIVRFIPKNKHSGLPFKNNVFKRLLRNGLNSCDC